MNCALLISRRDEERILPPPHTQTNTRNSNTYILNGFSSEPPETSPRLHPSHLNNTVLSKLSIPRSKSICVQSLTVPRIMTPPIYFIIILVGAMYISTAHGGQAWTNVLCGRTCPASSIVRTDNFRALGNKVDRDFRGWQDVWASSGASVFASNMQVHEAAAWPRIFEGCTEPLVGRHRTPGYPVSVATLTRRSARTRYIAYSAHWTGRSHGPTNGDGRRPTLRGPRQHGAYIWLNDPFDGRQWNPYPVPKWPYGIEINVWNLHSGGGYRRGSKRFADYYDNDGRYEVRGHHVCHKGDCFYAYYVTLVAPKRSRNKVNINVKTLLAHLRDNTWNGKTPPAIKSHHEVIEISVAAEGYRGMDGKFVASIATMGR